uniref:GEO11132p1 n=2 Tax=Drosophila melanogaster TaxID=7227 RepID=Q6IGP4_DROME|eukprot:NP_001033940.1 uncharacterized protein Dmel_CG34054 [Drosophila melanogaster]
MYFGKVISLFLFCFLLGGIWAQDVIPEIPEDVRPTEPTTTTTTDATRTSTTKSTTTTTTEPTTTTSTTKPITTSTTQRPPFEQPTRTTEIPGVWMQPIERCFLRNQMKYNTCWPVPPRATCYRCCYYYDSHITECSKLHQGPCVAYDYGQLKVHVNWKQVL